jgi:hypothetical protein
MDKSIAASTSSPGPLGTDNPSGQSEAEVTRLSNSTNNNSRGNSNSGGKLRLSLKLSLLLAAQEQGLLWEFGGQRRLRKLSQSQSPDLIEYSRYLSWLIRNNHDVHLFNRLWSQHGKWLNSYVRPLPEYRKIPKRRIGVGYRDKGSLPSGSSAQIAQANQESWIYAGELAAGWLFRPGVLPQLEFEGEWCRIIADPLPTG